MTQTRKDPEDRRSEILDAAAALFGRKGYDQATVSDILEAVDIGKGTFYYYFQSKEEVLDAIVMRDVDMAEAMARKIAARPGIPAYEKLGEVIGELRVEAPNPTLKEHLHRPENAKMHHKSHKEMMLRISPILADIVAQGIEEGVFHTPYPRETMEFLLMVSIFLFDEGLFGWTPEEMDRKAVAFAHIMEKLLGAEEGSFAYIAGCIELDLI